MNTIFYLSAIVAIVSTIMVVTRRNAVHAVLYLLVSFFAVASMFFVLGAPFAAALEIIIYAGAIMVLFVFIIMLLDVSGSSHGPDPEWMRPTVWVGPLVLAAILAAEMVYIIAMGEWSAVPLAGKTPKEVGVALFGPYLIAVELASMLLFAGLVGAHHLGRRHDAVTEKKAEGS